MKRPGALVVSFVSIVSIYGAHCGATHEASFTPASDAAFANSLRGTYVAASSIGEVTLSLCPADDVEGLCAEPSIGQATACTSSCHIIRSDGRGENESLETEDNACSCSTPSAELGVRVRLAWSGGSSSLDGPIQTTPAEGAPYGPPVRIFTGEKQTAGAAVAKGWFMQDGRLQLDVRATSDAGATAVPGVAEKLFFTRKSPDAECMR
ncbi:hypothetical protein AKJ09_10206 [Labilithrix luteola]|uniref:Uncharacterized protein n=1 Tax=Labilithrix luteola TaxID=1391654 RepID=A0A0K1QCT6_9BACT|nr:hypothetical protein [Labilithrix luteola]AKV03543.1 hypothetical protein AKJ09_10206 [Labilithrix luteola]